MKKINFTLSKIILFTSSIILAFVFTVSTDRIFKITYTIPIIIVLLFFLFFSKRSFLSQYEINDKVDIIFSFLLSIPFYFSIKDLFNVSFTKYITGILNTKVSILDISTLYSNYNYLISNSILIFSLISFVFIFSFFISTIKKPINIFYNELDKIERFYFFISSIIFVILITFVYSFTNIFYLPNFNNELISCDVVLQSDTGGIVSGDEFSLIKGNGFDIKQPLFGLFSLPFGLLSKLVSYLLFFIPNSYYIALGFTQGVLMIINAILLVKLLNLNNLDKLLFLLFYTISFPTILFILNLEQYVYPTFWLILFIYTTIKSKKIYPFIFAPAFGTILTNGFIFIPPLIVYYKNIKSKIAVSLKSTIVVLSIILVSGLAFIFEFPEKIIASELNASSQVNGLYEKSVKYSHFIVLNFISPRIEFSSKISEKNQIAPIVSEKVYSGYNYIGIFLFLLLIYGFTRNLKNTFTLICFYWVLYSLIFLMIIGWGSIQNAGMFLTTILYSWAFISLLFITLNSLFENNKKIKYTILISMLLAISAINILSLINILQFSFKNYPTI